MTTPHHSNPCGSDICDFLQVKVTSECDGICKWCSEKRFGFTPKQVSLSAMKEAITHCGKPNIVFMGGEPTQSEILAPLIRHTVQTGKQAWIWTNGYSFGRIFSTPCDIDLFDLGIAGATLSIHHFDLVINRSITGRALNIDSLQAGFQRAKSCGVNVQLTCSVVKGGIDTRTKLQQYVNFAVQLGANKIRFTELATVEDDSFVSLHALLGRTYVNQDPFVDGCDTTTEINGLKVTLSTMCGLNNRLCHAPIDFEVHLNPVLYTDGKIRDGWVISVPK